MKAKIRKSSVWLDKEDLPVCDGAIWDESLKCWTIELNTIEDIFELPAHKVIVFSPIKGDEYDFEVELYDNYRE